MNKILAENSTHRAIINGDQIDVYIKPYTARNGVAYPYMLWDSVPIEERKDLLAIFSQFGTKRVSRDKFTKALDFQFKY